MPDAPRPDPDALLALAQGEGRGGLKVFLGAAPGVGKTVEMLEEARKAREGGADLLIGVLETHGRADTEAAALGLPVLPRRRVEYRGQVLDEFDLDAALARRPAVLLLDELAHTNAPRSRHPKRWMDVEELRDAGVEVWTTMNVQHLESQSDAVARVTGVRVAETVPDRVLEGASSVELVDIPPTELLERMRQGKIYRPDQAERALKGFFKEGALAALREMALRRTAQRVDADVTGWMRRNAVEGPWPVGERVLALVPAAGAEAVLHQARRIADALRAPFLALHVERPGDGADPTAALRLAADLGAETEVVASADVPTAVLAHARARNVNHLVIGRGRPGWWWRLTGRTLTAILARRATDFSLHLVPTGLRAGAAASADARAFALPGWASAAAVPLLVGLATLACIPLDGMVPDAGFGMIYLAAIVALAAWLGPMHAAAGAALSFLAWNYLFLPPRHTFAIASPQDVLGAAVFGVVALILSGTTGRLGRSVRAATDRLASLRRLSALARRLNAAASSAELQRAVAEEAHRSTGAPACLLLSLDDALDATLHGQFDRQDPGAAAEPVARASSPGDAVPDEASMAAARWALANGREAGHGTATLPSVAWVFLPLRAARDGEETTVGLLGLRPGPDAGEVTGDSLDALRDLAAVALERSRLAEERARSRARGETEGLRTALLTSLGHDLRTPLTAIRGAAETLRTAGPALGEATRADLLSTVEEEAARLARWMTAILDVVRLESGEVRARREVVDVADALREAADRATRAPGFERGREVGRDLPDALPVPRLDPVLLDRVLENLLDNAAKYAGPGDAIRVAARREGGEAVLEVEDDGPGIPADSLPHVFAPFFRAGRADRVAAGSGLGLSICRGLVAAMGGRIAAVSPVRDGRGTRIVLRFPL